MLVKRKYFFIIIVILLQVFLFEVFSRMAFSIRAINRKIVTRDDDLFWEQKWFRRYSEKIEIYYPYDVYDPTRGWAVKPNIEGQIVFRNKVLNTNSKGLRGSEEYTYEKKSGITRILIFGDSFTFGDEVSDDETYAHYLKELLPETEILNFGVHGYGHDQMLIYLKEEGTKYRPDIIILGFVYADVLRNGLGFRDYAKPKYTLKDDELILTNLPVRTPESMIRFKKRFRLRMIDMLELVFRRLKETFISTFEEDTRVITQAILAEFKEVAISINSLPIFVFMPSREEFSNSQLAESRERYLIDTIRNNIDIECYSVLSEFDKNLSKEILFEPKGHWAPQGQYSVAKGIMKILVNEGYLQ